MIPSIEDIVEGLLLKLYTAEQAKAWLRSHIQVSEDAADAKDMRDSFAAAALTAMTRMVNDNTIPADTIAAQAFHIADEMLKERERPSTTPK